jgi:HK97 family phage prohead protease
MLNRAYSLLEIKSVDEDERIITGIATTPTADRDGDIVEPKGAEFKLPIPLLWQHDSRQPIGEVFYAKVTSAGIEIKARIVKIAEPGTLKDRLDEAWQSIKAGLVKGLSIGFRSVESARIDNTYAYRFMKWLWLELSAVTIPANADASIQTIKSLDVGRPAATGTGRESSHTPGDTGASRAKARTGKATMKTTAEKILALKSERASKLEKMNDLSSAVPDGETMGEAQLQESNELKGDIKTLNAEIVRLEEEQELNKSAAAPVTGDSQAKGSQGREAGSSRIVTLKQNLPPGTRFARAAMCVMAAKGSRSDAIMYADQFYKDDPAIAEFIKTAVPARRPPTPSRRPRSTRTS